MTTETDRLRAIQQEKETLRDRLSRREGATLKAGKLAQLLRKEGCYRRAGQIFVGPAPVLQQVRINGLLDGKDLIMPGPGLKDGFFLLKPFTVPFGDLPFAVTSKGLAKFARKLSRKDMSKLNIDFLATDALAVDLNGNRLGDGTGFFDIAHAVLSTMDALAEGSVVAAIVGPDQIAEPPLPTCNWDVPVNIVVTEEDIHAVPERAARASQIYWDSLSEKKIRKMTPLWWLRDERGEV